MKKLYLLTLTFIYFTSPLTLKAQGISSKNADTTISKIENNRKTSTPFSINFKNSAMHKSADAQKLFVKYLNLKQNTDELRLVKNDNSGGDIIVEHYQQYFKGIKVEHGSYSVTSKNSFIAFMMGDFYSIAPSTLILPTISEDAARSKAWAYIDGTEPPNVEKVKGELVFVENSLGEAELTGKVHLAYKFLIFSQKNALVTQHVYVDAATGVVLFTNSTLMTGCFERESNNDLDPGNSIKNEGSKKTIFPPNASVEFPNPQFDIAPGASTIYSGNVTNMVTRQVGGVYRLEAQIATEGYPVHVRNFLHVEPPTTFVGYDTTMNNALEITDADNNWTAAEFANANYDNTALDVHWGAQRVYDYWKTRHNRLSWDGANAVINCFVHVGTNYNNAYWQGASPIFSMFYGDGSNVAGGFSTMTALDITAHEIGHAVCQSVVANGAGLTYNRESGALNEGFSDIWGASIERFADPHETDAVAKRYFDIGEEVGLPIPNNPLRSMSNPKLFGQPNTYLGTFWRSTTVGGCPVPNSGNDNCGVHYNSGVLNYWFYLLVNGGAGTNDFSVQYSVPAIGWNDAELIAFLGEKNLTATSNYLACRTAMINAAIALFGACSIQTEAVTRAWYAVNVGDEFIPCNPQINFVESERRVSETVPGNLCGGSKIITIPVRISAAATGGNPVATITATGTASNGNDYILGTTSVTFAEGTTTQQLVTITINDDGMVEADETILLQIASVNANGSNATKANAFIVNTITIVNDDKEVEYGNNTLNNYTVGVQAGYIEIQSPFMSAVNGMRRQVVVPASELTAAGLVAGGIINSIGINVLAKFSTQPFTGYTISLGNTTLSGGSTAFITGLTQVFTGDVTTVPGLNTLNLLPLFAWDGTSNLVVQFCFSNTTAGTISDRVSGFVGTGNNNTWATSLGNLGCDIVSASTTATIRPVLSFGQYLPATKIESSVTSTRQWAINDVNTNNNFYSVEDGELVAKIKSNNLPLGCVTATVLEAGNTWQPFFNGFRSQKAIQITPTLNGSTTSYNATFYFTTAELAGRSVNDIKLFKTTASTLAGATTANTFAITPVITSNAKGEWYSFSANFTGFSTFFVGDANIVLPVTIVNFSANKIGSSSRLKWEVTHQLNVEKYSVEHSADGISFKTVGSVIANNSTSTNYTFTDVAPLAGLNYYRLKIINNNGYTSYSPILLLDFSGREKLIVSPNPVTSSFTIQYSNNALIEKITLLDASGKKLKEYNPQSLNGSISVDIDKYPAGVYLVRMTDKNKKTVTQRIVKK